MGFSVTNFDFFLATTPRSFDVDRAGKAGKQRGAPVYDAKIKKCVELVAVFKCCQLAANITRAFAHITISEV